MKIFLIIQIIDNANAAEERHKSVIFHHLVQGMPTYSSASSGKSLSNLIVSNVTVDDCDNSPFSSYQLFALKIKIN